MLSFQRNSRKFSISFLIFALIFFIFLYHKFTKGFYFLRTKLGDTCLEKQEDGIVVWYNYCYGFKEGG
ncbi:hypothetical protein DCMF_21055 [Candidatus Formimonas warabiya]|uniref:Uncharacterized protein n=1 Tax=Formimonas warabiya TaxID=1761012 RepID=A0A3G1KWT8_FORW1|nr:hypothetical protein DCMF_21055 [Candidatus Formimonas warabiya]